MACGNNINVIKSAFERLGVPLAPDKIIGLLQTITYLGIEIDSINCVIRLPKDKLDELICVFSLLAREEKVHQKKKDLLSLIGSLSFACKVVKCGRFFLRRLIDLSTTVHSLLHHISINSEARKDIQW